MTKEEKYVLTGVFWKITIALFILIGIVFAFAQSKVSQAEYDKSCEAQTKVNDEFRAVIARNNNLLIRVDQKLEDK